MGDWYTIAAVNQACLGYCHDQCSLQHPEWCVRDNSSRLRLLLMVSLIVWASYLYYSPPRYLAAFLVNLAAAVLAIILATVTRVYLQRQNHKMERGLDVGRNGPTPAQIVAGFRYVV